MTAAALRQMQGAGAAAEARAAVALLAAVYPGGGERNPAFSPQWRLCARLTPHVRALWATGAAPEGEATYYLLNQSAIYLGSGLITRRLRLLRCRLRS